MIEICHISPISIHSTRWIAAFKKRGYGVSLITDFETWVAQKPEKVPIYVLPTLFKRNAHRRFIPNYISVMKILGQVRPDVLHLHALHHYAPVAAHSHVPYLLHSWGIEVLELHQMSTLRKVLAKYAATKAGKIVVDAECMKEIWISAGVPSCKVEVIPFGVDTRLFNPKVGGGTVRKTLNIDQNDIVVISTRPFFPHYDIECLIKSIPLITKKRKDVKFMIKGTGPLENDVKYLVKRLHVDKYVRFTSPVVYEEVPRYLTAADIYVSTSFVDSTSVSLLEAMACGLPPVTTDILGNREWIKHEVNGLLYSPKDYKALARNILQLVEDKALRNRFGEMSRQIIAERATWDKCVSRMEAVYHELL